MTSLDDTIRAAAECGRAGNISGAMTLLEDALVAQPAAPQLLEFLGYLAATSGNHAVAVDAYRRLLDLDAANLTARVNLATAMATLGRWSNVEMLSVGHDHPKLQRLAAYVHQQRGADATSAMYERLVAANPEDGESWNNLGNSLLAEGKLDAALEAFDRAIQLRPDALPIYFNFSNALFLAERHEARRLLMRQAVDYAPTDPRVWLELGLAEAARGDMGRAEAGLRSAITLDPGFSRAFVELALLLENLSRIDDLADLIEEARQRDPDAPELLFLRAWLLRRRGEAEAALVLAEQVPATIHPLRRFQLIADLHDRLGDADRAFAAFSAMNQAAIGVQRPLEGPSYLELLEAIAENMDDVPRDIRPLPPVPDAPPAPIFIVGFPRSGTTLLDTLLMNVPGVHVLEELPALSEATVALGQDEAGLAALDDDQARAMRARYFERVDALSPGARGQVIIDKHPLHMTRLATIHRLFPNARIVLVERHPCDAVLSCFMANFQLNKAMRSFTTLQEAARVYDAAFTVFNKAVDRFPGITVIRVRYERMVADLEKEMRPLLAALELPWAQDVLDNRKSAARRERVRTASYAQITEPLYQRAVARWERYRPYLEPVMPILAPWAQRMNYPIE